MRKTVLIGALALAATACGDLFPDMPKSPHHTTARAAPQPQPGAATAAGGSSRTAPQPQPNDRPLVDYSALDKPETETEPTAAATASPAAIERPPTEAEATPAAPTETRNPSEPKHVPTNWRERHEPKVELLSAGAEPRSPLAFALKKGHAETITMTLGMGLAMEADGRSIEVPELPPVRMKLRLYVTDVRRNGDIAYEAVVHEVDVLEKAGGGRESSRQRRVRSELEKATSKLVGLSGTGLVTAQGLTKHVDFRVAAGAAKEIQDYLEQIEQSASQFSAPFPTEAVGVGAEWRVRTFVNQRGMRLTQVATYQVIRKDDRGASMLVKVRQLAEKQRMHLPDMPRGSVVQLEQLSGQGNGRVVVSPDRLGPVNSKLDLLTQFEISAKSRRETQTLGMKLDLDLTVSTDDLADGVRLTGGEDGGPKQPRRSRIVR